VEFKTATAISQFRRHFLHPVKAISFSHDGDVIMSASMSTINHMRITHLGLFLSTAGIDTVMHPPIQSA